ncbi:MAG: thiol-disulfide oxidoreductase DCC family protein [Bacilli bacterium]
MIIFFDGECAFCAKSVQWIVQHESAPVAQFCSLQSAFAKETLANYGTLPDSVILYTDGTVYTESEAAIRIATLLRTPYSWLQFVRYVPRSLRDGVYRFIARNRKLFGGREATCALLGNVLAGRIIE